MAFLEQQAKDLNLPFVVHYPVNQDNPVLVITWTGSQPELPSIVLNSHMDVVPVFADRWTHPPFAADIDTDGKIFARGAQDMKCVGLQYLAAIRALKRDGIQQFKRTIHITFVADEETGGHFGMEPFVQTESFKALNVGFALDEGIASPNDEFNVYYAERTIWHIEIKCFGQSGHGSLLFKHTPGEKLNYMMNKLMEFRKNESLRLENNPELTIGDVTSVNLTMLSGGVQDNVVPPVFTASFDIRLANNVDDKEFEKQVIGGDAKNLENISHLHSFRYIGGAKKLAELLKSILHNGIQKHRLQLLMQQIHFGWHSRVLQMSCKYFIDGAADHDIQFRFFGRKLKIKTLTFPGGTDSRYIRRVRTILILFK